jgi:hypothetical protein
MAGKMSKDRKTSKFQEIETEVTPVLFRIWIYRTESSSKGVIDLEYPVGGFFFDTLEAIVQLDPDGVFRLSSRHRGKDIPEEWYPIIESHLLAPLSVGSISLYAGHLFGEGKLCEVVNLKLGFSERRLRNVRIISPLAHARRQGYENLGDWPMIIQRERYFSATPVKTNAL